MSLQPISIQPLDQSHDRGVFQCGVKFIDSYLAKRCLEDHEKHKARVYVATEIGQPRVLGFYTLSLTSISPNEGPEEAEKKFGTWAVPLVYLGQIGVHQEYQKSFGIGSALMLHAFERTIEIADIAGTYGLSLDAIDEDRAAWYERLSFQRFGIEDDGRIKMMCPIFTIKEALNSVV